MEKTLGKYDSSDLNEHDASTAYRQGSYFVLHICLLVGIFNVTFIVIFYYYHKLHHLIILYFH